MDIDWRGCYRLLYKIGTTDTEIAALASTTRVTVNRVRNHPAYAEGHKPHFDSGVRILKRLRAEHARGRLTADELKSIGLDK